MNGLISNDPQYSENRIEKILGDSVTLFNKTGMEDLADKWEIILRNYQRTQK